MSVILFAVGDFNLTDLLGAAGATIGVIISGTIFLQFLSSKSTELAKRYRELAKEYRQGEVNDARHSVLQPQIRIFRRRLWLLLWASWLAGGALVCFIFAVVSGGISMLLPKTGSVNVIGAVMLFVGLGTIALAVFLEVLESIFSRHELHDEVGDLDDPVKAQDVN
jgi:hypothetical protein